MARILNKNTSNIKIDKLVEGRLSLGNLAGKNTGDSIDLEDEIRKILYGSGFNTLKGHYVKIEHVLYREPIEKNYNKVLRESRGGKPFKTYDQYVRTYRARPKLTQYNENLTQAGVILTDTYHYYFTPEVVLTENDFIYEYDTDIRGNLLEIDNYKKIRPKQRYNVSMIDPRSADGGDVEYLRVVATKSGAKDIQ